MRKLLFFIAALFTTCFAQAQDGIKLGVRAGINLSSWTGEDAENIILGEDPAAKLGFHLGGFLDYGVTDMISVRPELLYSKKGFRVEEDDITVKVNTNYIDVPVLARANYGNLFFEAGPTFSFNISSKVKIDNDGDKETEDFEDVFGTEMKTFDFGYAIGLGYQLPMGIGAGIRYHGGFSRIDEEGDAKIRNSVFQLTLSYTLKTL